MISPVKQLTDDLLTQEERSSPVWQSMRAHFERMLAKLRIENDNPELTAVETATLRGRIECLKSIRDLGKEPPPKVAPMARPSPRPAVGDWIG